MFNKFKDISIKDDSIRKTAEDYNIIIDKFTEFSYCFIDEHENDLDLLKIKNVN